MRATNSELRADNHVEPVPRIFLKLSTFNCVRHLVCEISNNCATGVRLALHLTVAKYRLDEKLRRLAIISGEEVDLMAKTKVRVAKAILARPLQLLVKTCQSSVSRERRALPGISLLKRGGGYARGRGRIQRQIVKDMSDILTRILSSIRSDGLSKTLAKCFRYPFRRDVMRHCKPAKIFSEIYKKNGYWGSTESASGWGSSLDYTANLRQHLPQLFKDFSVTSIYDAPCGDFNWMRLVIQQSDITYYGADIVPEMIDKIQKQYGTPKVRFKSADITLDEFPKVDLWFCRDCLFHLSNRDIILALRNFLASGTPLVFTTTHLNSAVFENVDVSTGGFRRIDLFSAPYFFPREVLARIPDWVEPWPPREMCLWTREQVAGAVQRMEAVISPAGGRWFRGFRGSAMERT
jgi:Methyltransferase domain